MAHIVIPTKLPELVRVKFNAAKDTQQLTFWSTQVSILRVKGVPFQLRYSPSIAQKPKPTKLNGGNKPIDPFLEPPEALFITDLGSPTSHILVLNKFAIVPEHFILATKEFKEQTYLLEEDDLGVAYACLQAWKAQGKDLFGFFNSGEHSGASQPHRHIQFLPVESMLIGVTQGEWCPLVDKLTSSSKPDLPFTYFATSLPPNPTPAQLLGIYMSLHDKSCRTVEDYLRHHPGDGLKIPGDASGSSTISYNLGLTDKAIVLIPRRAEGSVISTGDETSSVGPIALNGTVLAGTLLVKNETEWNTLRSDASQLLKLLEVIGIPVDLASEKL